jgi:predicted Rossmann fold flavoprotein
MPPAILSSRKLEYDVIVIGAGAAGLFCSAIAGARCKRVALLEHSLTPGRKILISGGGRCNFTNLRTGPGNFLSANPHFAKSALARYTPSDFLALLQKHHVSWHEKTLGQLFCDRSARDVLNLLTAECSAAGVEMVLDCRISSVTRDTRFRLETSRGVFIAECLIVASGGLSIPKIGATGFGYDIARQFSHEIVEPYPALVPLTFDDEDRRKWCDLSGVALPVDAAFGRHRFAERMLITHRGLSGPAILQISSYWRQGESIRLDLLPGGALPEVPAHETARALELVLPQRFARRWLETEGFTQPVLPLRRLSERLHHWTVHPAGTEGFEKAEVTGGGVSTAGLSSQTMQSKHVPGLFFIGEVVDVTGHLGGYNFQWAWSSAYAAGSSI